MLAAKRFDCGSGGALIRTTNVVDIGKWNTVEIHRREWSAWISLNNGTQTAGRSKVGHAITISSHCSFFTTEYRQMIENINSVSDKHSPDGAILRRKLKPVQYLQIFILPGY